MCVRTLKRDNSNEAYIVGIDILKGGVMYINTHFIIITSRHEVFNQTEYDLQISQHKFLSADIISKSLHEKVLHLASNTSFPLHWASFEKDKKIYIKISSPAETLWSEGIQIHKNHSMFLNIQNSKGDLYFLRLETIRHRAKYFLVLMNSKNFPPPIRIDNYTTVPLQFYQENTEAQFKYTVKPNCSKAYVLKQGINDKELLSIEAPGGNSCQCRLSQFEEKHLTYENFIYIEFVQHIVG